MGLEASYFWSCVFICAWLDGGISNWLSINLYISLIVYYWTYAPIQQPVSAHIDTASDAQCC